MKNAQAIMLLNGLSSFKGNKGGVKFTYAVNKNKRILGEYVKTVNESLVRFEDGSVEAETHQEFETKRLELARKHANKNEKGEPLVKNGNFTFSQEGAEGFQKEFESLKSEEKYVDVLAQVEEFDKKNNDLLNAEVDEDLKLYKIGLDNLPELTVEEQDLLFDLIEE
jgi:5'-3' exonuclease